MLCLLDEVHAIASLDEGTDGKPCSGTVDFLRFLECGTALLKAQVGQVAAFDSSAADQDHWKKSWARGLHKAQALQAKRFAKKSDE
eukprot:314904-Alexandrium_andersonii.AAC.1